MTPQLVVYLSGLAVAFYAYYESRSGRDGTPYALAAVIITLVGTQAPDG